MALLCPECRQPSSLHIVASLELPPDSRSDEITLQVVECARCGFAGLTVYEESRRGAWDSESFDHTGYRVLPGDLEALKEQIRQCPDPTNARCTCLTHRVRGRQDKSGRWVGLDDIRTSGTFGLELSG